MIEKTRFKRYDKCDPSLPVLKLTRAVHYLWHLRRNSGLTVVEHDGLYEALEVLWRLKREVKAQIAQEKAEALRAWRSKRPAADAGDAS